jgi:hypothetical protein
MSRPARTQLTERERNIYAAFTNGVSMPKIGESYGMSRQRVQQILKRRFAAGRSDGGQKIAAQSNAQSAYSKREAICIQKYGMTLDEYRHCREVGATVAFKFQKKSAQYRGVDWSLSFSDWWKIWERSGKWEQRGRGTGKYCLARIGDKGGYSIGNVYVSLFEENGREYQRNKAGAPKSVSTGVCRVYPGLRKSFLAKYGRKSLGLFETASEAIAARQLFMASR